MRSLPRLGLSGLLLLACLSGGAAAGAGQPLDEPSPFGVMQFAQDEAWIDLPMPLLETWKATLATLAEMKYAVALDAAYVDSNGRIEVDGIWIAVEPHGTREKAFTRIRISLVATDKEYAQVRAESILDAVATRLSPVPAPARDQPAAPAAVDSYPSQPAPPPVDPAYQDPYAADLIYGVAAPLPGGANVYDASYPTYASYPTPYYADYSYYAPCGNYFPYWNCWNGWNTGWNNTYWSGNYSWAGSSGYGYWSTPTWGWGSWGCSPWWNVGFSSCWNNCWSSWGWCGWGAGLVVVVGDDCDDDDDCDDNNNNSSNDQDLGGDDFVTDDGDGILGIDPQDTDLSTVASAAPVDMTEATSAGDGRFTSADELPATATRGSGRSGSLPRIRVTERPRQAAGPRFDPRTVVTRTVATGALIARSPSFPTVTRTSVPRVAGSASTSVVRATPRAGTVVRMSSPTYRPGFVGVRAGSPSSHSGGSLSGTGTVSVPGSAPYGVSSGAPAGNPYSGGSSGTVGPSSGPVSAPVPVAHMPVSSPTPAQHFAPAPMPAPAAPSGPTFGGRPPPVTAPSMPHSSGPSLGSSGSFGGGSHAGPSSGGGASSSSGSSGGGGRSSSGGGGGKSGGGGRGR